MPIMNEAVSKEDFDLMERGMKPAKKKVEPRPEPPMPVIEQIVKVVDIPENYTVRLDEAFRSIKKNKDGMRFIGYDVVIRLIPVTPEEKKAGRPFEPKTLTGWMIEGEFLALLRKYSKEIDRKVIHW